MGKINKIIVLLISSGFAAACGNNETQPAPETASAQGRFVGFKGGDGLDTVIIGAQGIPLKLDATALSLSFRANHPSVRFECRREGVEKFSACPLGKTYKFASLRNGAAYELAVRAVKVDNSATDQSPAVLRFTVDRQAGVSAFSQEAAAGAQQDAMVNNSQEVTQKIADGLPIAISPFYQIRLPQTMVLERLITRQTISKTIFLLEALANGNSSQEEQERCQNDWQRPVYIAPYQITYCEGTPSESVWRDAGRSTTYDALELAQWQGSEAVEQLVYFASYGSEEQSNEIAAADGFCQSPRSSGQVFINNLGQGQLDYRQDRHLLSWCRVPVRGQMWWTGKIDLRLLPETGAPRVVVHYAIAESQQISDIGSFVRRFQNFALTRLEATGAQ